MFYMQQHKLDILLSQLAPQISQLQPGISCLFKMLKIMGFIYHKSKKGRREDSHIIYSIQLITSNLDTGRNQTNRIANMAFKEGKKSTKARGRKNGFKLKRRQQWQPVWLSSLSLEFFRWEISGLHG